MTRTRCRPLIRPVALPVALVLAVALSGCTDDESAPPDTSTPTESGQPGHAEQPGHSEQPSHSGQPSDSGQPSESASPAGQLMERPAYTVRVPVGWQDTTEDSMLDLADNTLRTRGHDPPKNITAHFTFFPDTPSTDIEEDAQFILEQAHDVNPGIERVADTTFAGEKAIHTRGPGGDPGTYFQGFDFIHDGDLVEIRIQTSGGRAASQRVVDLVKSSWEWK